jgi:hypothetical protein
MTDLSPAAQAVLDAYSKHVSEWLKSSKTDKPSSHYHASGMAAALRAAADQVVPQAAISPQQDLDSRREAMEWGMANQAQLTRQQLLAIADELEGQ